MARYRVVPRRPIVSSKSPGCRASDCAGTCASRRTYRSRDSDRSDAPCSTLGGTGRNRGLKPSSNYFTPDFEFFHKITRSGWRPDGKTDAGRSQRLLAGLLPPSRVTLTHTQVHFVPTVVFNLNQA